MLVRIVITAGGIIVDKAKILLIRHKGGGLAIAKGHVEVNETLEQAALREVEEETAYRAVVLSHLGSLQRTSIETTGETVSKIIEVYKMGKLSRIDRNTDEKPEWVDPTEAIAAMHFQEEADFLQLHIDELKSS
jgi:8-oxo-dGTP pyrophosphatase MutT (NUDIX family)